MILKTIYPEKIAINLVNVWNKIIKFNTILTKSKNDSRY